jgi:hypothetical protein
MKQAQKQLYRRGLARTVWSKQPEHLASTHFEIDIVHGARLGTAPKIFKNLCKPADGDDDL